ILRGQFSECCAPSLRNAARDQIGTVRAIALESAQGDARHPSSTAVARQRRLRGDGSAGPHDQFC
ncbi:hypothetical protein, partial [Bradyrhizobium sp. 138]|uniref:hypothetical protein n=1 Tax=Bradyrhizobium sp. 138 TaxID=2782615 RepID=UPI001FFC0C5F